MIHAMVESYSSKHGIEMERRHIKGKRSTLKKQTISFMDWLQRSEIVAVSD